MKVFEETQRFTQLWIIVLVIISGVVPLLIVWINFLKEGSSISNVEFLVTFVVTLFITSIIFFFKLKTRIDEKGIHYQFIPFHLKKKTIPWNTIEKVYVRKYNAITEYGGWGLKGGFFWRKSKGIAINVSGDIGIQIELKSGEKILIGTNQEQKAEQVLQTYNSKLNTKYHESEN